MGHAIRGVSSGMLLLATLPAAVAQVNYPTQRVRVIVTTAPGGGLDTFARGLSRELSERAGQQFVVDNRAGAGTTIGTALVAKSKPDGYTVLVSTSSFAISPATFDDSVRQTPSRPETPLRSMIMHKKILRLG